LPKAGGLRSADRILGAFRDVTTGVSLLMTDYVCPLGCTESPRGPIRKHPTAGIEYQLFHCRGCDLMFWYPPEFPEPGYYDHLQFSKYVLFHTLGRTEIMGHQLGFVECFRGKKGKLLDVGCSDGNFLAWARAAGYQVYGLDVDEASVKVAKKVTSNVWNMHLDDFASYAAAHQLQFDIITLFETLEHQPDPHKVLRQVLQLLLPGGWIAGTVPNRDRLFKTGRSPRGFWGDFPPHHFLWFNPTALVNALRQAHFQDVRVKIRMNGYWTEEMLHTVGKSLKENIVRNASSRELPLERLTEVGLTVDTKKMNLMYFLRAIKNVVKFAPKAVEFLIEKPLGKGGSLYFEGKRPEN
jgi:SAM-dependent methyltransferase